MKNVLCFGLVLSFLLPDSALAGTLYGTVRIGKQPAVAVRIFVACPRFDRSKQAPQPVVTDSRGSFSLRVPATGRCEMQAQRNDQVGRAFEVLVSNNALRLDLELDSAMNQVR